MCRLFAAVAGEPIDVRYELVEATNPLRRQAELHDSGWGLTCFDDAKVTEIRDPLKASVDPEFERAADTKADLFIAHLRRATIGGISAANTHPFSFDGWYFCHNGTIHKHSRLLGEGMQQPAGDTDSEAMFNFIMAGFDAGAVVESLQGKIAALCRLGWFSALNFLLTDGTTLYAYHLGLFPVMWTTRHADTDHPVTLVATEPPAAEEHWNELPQDTLLICDTSDPGRPRLGRLVGAAADKADFVPLEGDESLRGSERGAWAAARALDA